MASYLLNERNDARTMEPHVYQMNRFTQAFYCAGGLACIGFGVYFGRSDFTMFLMALPFLIAPGIYCCCWALRPRLTLTETEVSVRYVFGEDFAQRSDIEGWRTDSGGNSGLYWVLQLRGASGTLRINQNFAVDDVFLDFLSNLRNLNEGELSIAP